MGNSIKALIPPISGRPRLRRARRAAVVALGQDLVVRAVGSNGQDGLRRLREVQGRARREEERLLQAKENPGELVKNMLAL